MVGHASGDTQDDPTAVARRRIDLVLQRIVYRRAVSTGPDADWWGELPLPQDEASRGIAVDSLPASLVPTLLACGVPLAPAGSGDWRWGDGIGLDEQLTAPLLTETGLQLPTATERLACCNGVELKCLRDWVAQRCGLRLQAAPGLAFFVWSRLALVISPRPEPLAGFVHGPERGQRHVLSLAPGGYALLPLD